jgi:hypothetical protein
MGGEKGRKGREGGGIERVDYVGSREFVVKLQFA